MQCKTRQRVLEAACEIFAEKGFRGATLAEICRKANANIAAANYYFHDKRSLYVDAWRHAFERSLAAHPGDGGVPADAPAEQRLRGRVASTMRRIADPKSHAFDIVHKEMATPTGLLAQAMRECLEPLRRDMAGVIRELLGSEVTEQEVQLCHMSVMAQCFGPLLRERYRKRAPEALRAPDPKWPSTDVETLADHVVRFSLAGIREARESKRPPAD